VAGPVFLDRDGVINVDSREFIKSVAEWVPLPGALEAIARLCEAGYQVVVLTNQSGIARGLLSESTLGQIHQRMCREVEAAGGRLAGVYHCPHAPDDDCGCRKPETGLIDRACAELGFEVRSAPLVGDRSSDLEAARRAGCRPILLRSGIEGPEASEYRAGGDAEIYQDLAEAATVLVAEAGWAKKRGGRMANISMKRDHDLEPEAVRANIEALADKLADRLGGSWCWDGDTAVCSVRGAKARVGYDASSVSIDVSLPRTLAPFRRRLESKIEESFERYFRQP
jgi:D-glycero-D-manno-heptose 1,7-bisphosphate phosphatase